MRSTAAFSPPCASTHIWDALNATRLNFNFHIPWKGTQLNSRRGTAPSLHPCHDFPFQKSAWVKSHLEPFGFQICSWDQSHEAGLGLGSGQSVSPRTFVILKKEQDATTTSLGFLCSWQSQVNEGKSSFSAKQPTISNRHPKTIARFRQVLDEVWKTLAPLRDSSQSWSSQQPCTWQSSILIYINWQITETHAKHLNLNQSINSLIHPSFSIQGPLDNRFVMIKCPLSLDAQVTRCPGSLKQSTTWHVASSQASTNSAPRRASFSRTPSAVVHTKVGLQRADAFDKCKTKQTVTWPRFQRRKLATCKFTFQLAAFFRLGWSD